MPCADSTNGSQRPRHLGTYNRIVTTACTFLAQPFVTSSRNCHESRILLNKEIFTIYRLEEMT